MTPTNLHALWAARLMTALVEGGVRHVFVSPGSRSTPLVLALADEPSLTSHVVLDERSAAFLALGAARASGSPAAVIATSGTAPAHWFPAVIEASEAHVPLVLLSADRPWEALHAASPQTIDQSHLFGRHVRRFVDLGAPEASAEALRALPRVVAEALAAAHAPLPGPVHLNARFRKPLEPAELTSDEVGDAARPLLSRPSPRIVTGRTTLDASALRDVAELIAGSERGLVGIGPMPFAAARAYEELGAFAKRSGFAVYAEATSQLRAPLGDGAVVVPHLDLALRGRDISTDLCPDVIVEVGTPPVATSWAKLLDRATGARRIIITDHGAPDPRGDAHTILRGDVRATLASLAALLPVRGPTAFARALGDRDRALSAALSEVRDFGEGTVTELAARAVPPDGIFLVGNSSPVRDVDTFAPVPIPGRGVLHQRGASGIDGLIAQAIGATIATTQPVVALVGDLTFLHDASSLASARLAPRAVTLVVIDNGGGRIFDELPIAKVATRAAELERFFATPQAVDPEALGDAYGVQVVKVSDEPALSRALAAPHDGVRVIWATVARGSASAARAEATRRTAQVAS